MNRDFRYAFEIFDNRYVIFDIAWPWQNGWSLLRQRSWCGFRWPLASHHFHPLFRPFRPNWRKRVNAMSEMTKVTVCNKKNVLLVFPEAWNAYFIIRELWKDRFIIRKTWSTPPFTNLTSWTEKAIIKLATASWRNLFIYLTNKET